jgi:hypothetical protein
MAKTEASVEEFVSMIERGELRLQEMRRRYDWRSNRVHDLLDSRCRGYPSALADSGTFYSGRVAAFSGCRRLTAKAQ